MPHHTPFSDMPMPVWHDAHRYTHTHAQLSSPRTRTHDPFQRCTATHMRAPRHGCHARRGVQALSAARAARQSRPSSRDKGHRAAVRSGCGSAELVISSTTSNPLPASPTDDSSCCTVSGCAYQHAFTPTSHANVLRVRCLLLLLLAELSDLLVEALAVVVGAPLLVIRD